jgi:hypothetical protein
MHTSNFINLGHVINMHHQRLAEQHSGETGGDTKGTSGQEVLDVLDAITAMASGWSSGVHSHTGRTQAPHHSITPAGGRGAMLLDRCENEAQYKNCHVFDRQVLHYIAWKRAWNSHYAGNFPGLQGDTLRRVLVKRYLKPGEKEKVQYKSTVTQVWKYLNRAYLRQDTFLYDLMEAVHAVKDISEKNYRALEEFPDLLIWIFDIAKDTVMLSIVLHQNN